MFALRFVWFWLLRSCWTEECVVVPDGGSGCHGFVDVAIHWLNATTARMDPQWATLHFCRRHAVEPAACDVLFETVRRIAYAGLERVVSAASDSRYEYGEDGRLQWDGVLEVKIDRRQSFSVVKDSTLLHVAVGPEKLQLTQDFIEAFDQAELAMVRTRALREQRQLCNALNERLESSACWKRDNDMTIISALHGLAHCTRLFVDLGAHDGSTLRAFYEGGSSGVANWSKWHVDEARSYCALAVEPSLDFKPLHDLPNDVVWLAGYAVSNIDELGRVFLGGETQVGNSLRMEAPDVYLSGSLHSRPVKTIRFATFLAELLAAPVSHLIIKVDIEGAEYLVLRDLLATGVLCDHARVSRQTALLIEEHTYMRDFFDPFAPVDAIESYAHALRACGVEVFAGDHVAD